MPEYADLLPDIDPETLEDEVYEALRDRWPDWEPADGNLETWVIKALTSRMSELAETTVDVADEIFATYGAMRGILRFDPAPAVASSTWTLMDAAGYLIEAGTQVAVPVSGNESFTFEVTADVNASTTTATVPLAAVEPGAEANGLTGDPTLIDALMFVDRIELDAPTASGVDEEALSEYLVRLTERLRISTETPIVPRDFEVLARTYLPFVARAVARDGWNPGDSSPDNERMISLAVMDPDGETLSSPQKTEVQDLIESKREINFVAHVIDAEYTTVDVKYVVGIMAGYDMGDVRGAVDGELTNYLSPANWGRSQIAGEASQFVLQPIVRTNELISLIDRVPGVDYVDTVTTRTNGGGSYTAADITMPGAVPLTRPGAFS